MDMHEPMKQDKKELMKQNQEHIENMLDLAIQQLEEIERLL